METAENNSLLANESAAETTASKRASLHSHKNALANFSQLFGEVSKRSSVIQVIPPSDGGNAAPSYSEPITPRRVRFAQEVTEYQLDTSGIASPASVATPSSAASSTFGTPALETPIRNSSETPLNSDGTEKRRSVAELSSALMQIFKGPMAVSSPSMTPSRREQTAIAPSPMSLEQTTGETSAVGMSEAEANNEADDANTSNNDASTIAPSEADSSVVVHEDPSTPADATPRQRSLRSSLSKRVRRAVSMYRTVHSPRTPETSVMESAKPAQSEQQHKSTWKSLRSYVTMRTSATRGQRARLSSSLFEAETAPQDTSAVVTAEDDAAIGTVSQEPVNDNEPAPRRRPSRKRSLHASLYEPEEASPKRMAVADEDASALAINDSDAVMTPRRALPMAPMAPIFTREFLDSVDGGTTPRSAPPKSPRVIPAALLEGAEVTTLALRILADRTVGKSGYLTRRTKMRTWNTVWCVLKGLKLEVYLDPKDQQPNQVLTLDGCNVALYPHKTLKYTFCVIPKVGSKTVFYAASQGELEGWRGILRLAAKMASEPLVAVGGDITKVDAAAGDDYLSGAKTRMSAWLQGGSLYSRANSNGLQRVFGAQLPDEATVVDFVKKCTDEIRRRGLGEEGIFRQCGSTARMNALRKAVDAGDDVDLTNEGIHTVASLFKLFLRELPEPLTTASLCSAFLAAIADDNRDPATRLGHVRFVLSRLPLGSYTLLQHLVELLRDVAAASDRNRMTPGNLAVVFAPTLLQPSASLDGMQATVAALETLIVNADAVFLRRRARALPARPVTATFSEATETNEGQAQQLQQPQDTLDDQSAAPELVLSPTANALKRRSGMLLSANNANNNNNGGDDSASTPSKRRSGYFMAPVETSE